MRILLVLFLITTITVNGQKAYVPKSENAKGTSMMPIFNKAKIYIETFEKNDKHEIVRMEFDIVTTYKKKSWRTLAKGIKYSVIAFGDYRIKDIDISIFKYRDKKWVRVVKDKKEESFAVVSFTPDKTEEYKIEISVYEFKDNYKAAHYGLFVTR